MPERNPPKRQYLKQFLMAARCQQAGETDAGSANIVSWPWIGPSGPVHAEESVRPARSNLTGTAQFAPTVLDEREVINAIVLDRLPEAVQPLVARLSIRGSLDFDPHEFPLRPQPP